MLYISVNIYYILINFRHQLQQMHQMWHQTWHQLQQMHQMWHQHQHKQRQQLLAFGAVTLFQRL